MVAAEAMEHRPLRAVFTQVPQPSRDDRDLPVVVEVTALLPLSLPQMTGQLLQARDGGRSSAITVSLTAIGWEAPLDPAPRAVEPISVTGRRNS